MELCAREGIPLQEGEYEEAQFVFADEVFCTNSLRGIVPVRSLADMPEVELERNEVTSRLQALYGELMRTETE